MSNLIAFNNVVRRAQTKADNAVSLIENVPITTNAAIILFADKHIRMMEEQQAAMQRELTELRALVAVK
ncbi:hypothetical protein Erwinia_phage_Aioli_00070 [Erwinia phage Aioli]|nr:hypothetical protein Erwinia_phage_Aioli_00070 [Erwinia phage Aioli]